jgi:lysine 2,3-aminomutase
MTDISTLPFEGELPAGWVDWMWQQRNAIRSVEQLLGVFPSLQPEVASAIRRNAETRRLQSTPYYLSLIRRTPDRCAPLADDPMWRQIAPFWDGEGELGYQYDGETENWEMPGEMVTPITQHKYDNRVIVRLSNVCHGYCQFCYEALRTLEKQSSKPNFQQQHWDATTDYLRAHDEVEEVILSGGEPLMLTDDRIERVLADLRGLDRPLAVRIHTRALTFNPFRVTEKLTEIFRRYELTSIGLHVTHPNEITEEFCAAAKRLAAAVPIMFANIPLLRSVNDSAEVVHELGMRLYLIGVVPHYLYHFMPYSPGAEQFRTPVQTGVEIVRSLKRRVTDLAVPEFVLPHHTGKHTMPLLAEGEAPPQSLQGEAGRPVVRYTNWRGDVVDYFDAPLSER